MNFENNKKKMITFAVLGLFVLTGTYNAFIINSESHLSDSKFLKRLDEIHGVTISGRQLAGAKSWQKLAKVKMGPKKAMVAEVESAPKATETVPTLEDIPQAAVQESLSLNLVEVVNPKKFQNGAPASQFSGSLATNNGVIESLNVTLPGSESLSVAFSELTGNVFEYDFNGEIYSGMMYQVDQQSYMVTLTNGPLEGTRLRFSAETPAIEQQHVQEKLAENNIEVGTFGSEPQAGVQEVSEEMVQNDVAQQGFKF